jgi:sarcosine oxidase
MSNQFEVIVVGVGAMGACTCFHLARRGVRVLGLEQFSIPNTFGSSHGDTRAIRLAYYEHPDYVPLLRRSYHLWREAESLSGQKLLYITGGLYIGQAESDLVTGSIRSAETFDLPYEKLDRSMVADRFPQFEVPEDYTGIYEPEGGLLRPELSISVNTGLAIRHGAEIHGCEKVLDWKTTGSGAIVKTDRAIYQARRLIFCGGAWTGKLMLDIGVNIKVSRQIVGWVWPKKPEQFELGHFPIWAIAHENQALHYGFPMLSDRPGVKVAHHSPGTLTDPDLCVRSATLGDENDFLPALKRFLPDASGPLLSMSVCLYENSPDSHFIIDRYQNSDSVFVACGFSGHGFKFATVVGEALADLAEHGQTQLPIGFLGLHRFGI